MEISFEHLPQAVSQLHSKLENIERLIKANGNSLGQPQADQLLNVQQVAELLGLSVPTIYGYVQRAEIPVNKRSKRLYFSREEIVSWIKEGRKKTLSEIEAEAQNYLSKKG